MCVLGGKGPQLFLNVLYIFDFFFCIEDFCSEFTALLPLVNYLLKCNQLSVA